MLLGAGLKPATARTCFAPGRGAIARSSEGKFTLLNATMVYFYNPGVGARSIYFTGYPVSIRATAEPVLSLRPECSLRVLVLVNNL